MFRLMAVALLSALFASAPLRAMAMGKVPPTTAPAPAVGGSPDHHGAANPDSRAAHEPPAPHFSKFEARRIRHGCVGHANERGLKGPERSAYLSRCYFGHVSHRGIRHACQKEAVAKGVEKAAQRDFVRKCIIERSREKD
jgi:hypothetical protein